MKKITLLSLFAVMAFAFFGCGGGGLGLPGGSWDSGDGTTPVPGGTVKIIEVNGTVSVPAAPAPAGGPSRAADLSGGRYSLSVVDRDNPSLEAGTVSSTGGSFQAVIKSSAASRHAMLVLTEKQSKRVLYRNILGKVPKISELPSNVSKIVVNGIAVNEVSTARALFAMEKGLSDIAMVSAATGEVQTGGVVIKDFTGIKTDFDAAAENMAGGAANVTQMANAVQAVATVLAATSVNESTKNIISINEIKTATEMLTAFLNSLKNASTQQLITANNLATSVKIGETTVNSNTSQTAVNTAVSGVVPIAPAAAPVFQPAGGAYNQDVSVTITTSTPGAIIRYTLDGSTPGAAAGNIYSGPISVSNTVTIKAVAVKTGYSDSPVVTASYTLPVKAIAPVITPGEGTYTSAQSVTIVSSTAGATIKYTIDGSIPSETNGTVYSAPFNITATVTIKAIAIKSGMANSNITSASFVINTEKAATPVFSPAGGTFSSAQSVTISTSTAGAAIKYTTDGSSPSATNGLTYSAAISVSSTTTIKAVAVKSGMADSDAASATYTIQETVSAPVFSPPAGSYETAQSVSMVSATSGASIFYTTNGSTPTLLSSQYTSPVSITSTAIIKAIAIKTGMAASSVTSAAYTILQKVAAPAFNPAAGSYEGTQSVAITSATSGASIYYTLDGSTPNSGSSAYTGAVAIASNLTIKAIAVKSGMTNSEVSSASYGITFPPAADPVFSVASGTYNDTQTVSITSATSGAAIYYTVDGSTPSASSNLYTSAVAIGKTTFIKAIAVKAGMLNSAVSSASYVIDRLAPSFTIQYYSDSALSLSLGDTPRLSAGTYYLKITSTKELQTGPTITIAAEGSANDVNGAATTKVSDFIYRYTRVITNDAAAVGSVIENISISATDIAGNASNNVNPSDESAKAAYTDTIAPTAAITYAPSSTVKQGAAITISAVISESLMSSPTLKIAISGANTLAAADMTRSDATHYAYSHTAGAGGGIATIVLSNAKDLAGNVITAAPSSGATFTVDNTTLPAGTYKKVAAAPTTTVNDTYISGDTLTVGIANGPIYYYVATNATLKNIMGQLAANNTFTIDANGKVSAIDASIATGTPSIALTASQCAADVTVKGFADAALTLTGSAAGQAINLIVTGGTVVASDANLTGTIAMNTAAPATISSGAKAVTIGTNAAANAVSITATGGTVSIDAAASAVTINGIKVDPSATTSITVTDANTLATAGGATDFVIDATTGSAAKTFNFITTAQTGTISAKASETTNGLTITSATAASTGNITITGGKVDVSNGNLTGSVTYNTAAAADISSGTKTLSIGATTAANAVAVTATGGTVSIDAAASAVTINGIKVDPSVTAAITVNNANTLSTAGGATNFVIDATTGAATKTFNFITTAQTGTISAKASETTNGLTITSATAASTGLITVTGGKVDVSDGDLTGAITANTAASTISSGTKNVTTSGAFTFTVDGTGLVTIGNGGTVVINGVTVPGTTSATAQLTGNALAIGGTTAGAVVVDTASSITDITLNATTTSSLTNNKAALTSLTVSAAKTLTTLTNAAGNTITTLTDNGTITTLANNGTITTLSAGAGATITTLTLGTAGTITDALATGANLTITNIDQSATAADVAINLGNMTTTVTAVKGHTTNKLTLTSTATLTALTVDRGVVDIAGLTANTFNVAATADTKVTATGKTLAAVSGAHTIEIAGAANATVDGSINELALSGNITTKLAIKSGTVTNITGAGTVAALDMNGGTLTAYNAGLITAFTLNGGTVTTIAKNKMTNLIIGADAASTTAMNMTITGGAAATWDLTATGATAAASSDAGKVSVAANGAYPAARLTYEADGAANITFTGNNSTVAATAAGGANITQLFITSAD